MECSAPAIQTPALHRKLFQVEMLKKSCGAGGKCYASATCICKKLNSQNYLELEMLNKMLYTTKHRLACSLCLVSLLSLAVRQCTALYWCIKRHRNELWEVVKDRRRTSDDASDEHRKNEKKNNDEFYKIRTRAQHIIAIFRALAAPFWLKLLQKTRL